MLAISAYTDIRERNIYIVPLMICAAGGIMISLTAFIGYDTYSEAELFVDLIGPVVAATIVITTVRIFERYVGRGDGYLVAALGVLIGNRYNLYVAIAASLFAALFAIVMTLRKKKRFAACIPFAPFVMAGYLLVMANEI